MVDQVLTTIADKLRNVIGRLTDIDTDEVVIDGLTKVDPEEDMEFVQGKTCVTLVNLEEEKVMQGKSHAYNNKLFLNLSVMISARPAKDGSREDNYLLAVKKIADVMGYLRNESVWTVQNTPELGSIADKLIFEMQNLDFKQITDIWSRLGNEIQPAVLYKVKVVNVAEFVDSPRSILGFNG
ncbi:MAG: DUF4255 domain-containing protein [Thermonemataceae bacterium]